MGQAVFGLLISNIFAEVVNQLAVGAVGFGRRLAAEGFVFAFMPVPAGELLERPFGMVGLGDNDGSRQFLRAGLCRLGFLEIT